MKIPEINGAADLLGVPVRVYRNLHARCYSVQAKVQDGHLMGNARGPGEWRVVLHADAIALWGVTFRVSAAGRARVLATGRKNVHAFVHGTVSGGEDNCIAGVRYNPRTGPSFADSSGATITHAGAALLTPTGVTVRP